MLDFECSIGIFFVILKMKTWMTRENQLLNLKWLFDSFCNPIPGIQGKVKHSFDSPSLLRSLLCFPAAGSIEFVHSYQEWRKMSRVSKRSCRPSCVWISSFWPIKRPNLSSQLQFMPMFRPHGSTGSFPPFP